MPADATDEYIKIGESTTLESLKRFCCAVVEVFGAHYLRSPNAHDVARLLHIGERRGFPGMLGSLDCMHWKWKNCPTAWGGQYAGRSGSPTIILEAVADYDLWIWHAYFGLPRSNNDINVLEASHLFPNLVEEDERDLNAPIKERVEVPSPEVEMLEDDNARLVEPPEKVKDLIKLMDEQLDISYKFVFKNLIQEFSSTKLTGVKEV
ncbi:uncharacterized protein LOC115696361 [Cannabis sativa]|uniref:uncharacterized protein LOC115696361 n=1 Tax=Cannabis sativa TaxID=3483 RepID=UPI0011E0367D|nr:uncharacterized protein LOC115696361 [Cannabis sativa]